MSDTDDQVALIDDTIAADRVLYLRAYWLGQDGWAEIYVIDIQRLQTLRTIVERASFEEQMH